MGVKKKQVQITITRTQYFSAAQEQLYSTLSRLFSDGDGEKESALRAAQKEQHESSVELCTAGEMQKHREGVEISYDESEITGMPGCRTTFHVADNGLVTLTRAGKQKTHLVFENGKRHLLVSGAQNAQSVCVSCHRVRRDFCAATGGEISIDYAVEVGGRLAEHNAYTIRVSV